MDALLSPLKTFINKDKEAVTDTKIFRFHTIFTPAIFISASVIYSFKEFIGEPINCLGPNALVDDGRTQYVNNYCWVMSTYSVEEYFKPHKYQNVPYAGVGPLQNYSATFHRYYQFVPFFFLFLALFFYFPRYLWTTYEGGHIKMLMDKLDSPILEEEFKKGRLELLTNYIHKALGFNNLYASFFFCCEILNFLILILSFYLTDLLLNYKFASYGWDVFTHLRSGGRDEYNQRILSPMTIVFPKLTKCQVEFYGASGNVLPLEYICTMSVNNYNDKAFFVLWFYLIILGMISSLNLILRTITIFSSRLRFLQLRYYLGRSRNFVRIDCLEDILIGDWFILHQLSKNVDNLAYVDLLDMLNVQLEGECNYIDKSV